ncbi:hypothetical protein L218DRAFT_950281 [Marasmius fiardii PR-910]|nr:hypothetical protein L218DRAFT_950281 [Marasmius fiardii PR-910]
MSTGQRRKQHHPEELVQQEFLNVFVNPIMLNSCQLFLYGLYIFIFRAAIAALKRRSHPRSPECRFHIHSLRLLFILATVDIPTRLVGDVLWWKLMLWQWEGLDISRGHIRAWLSCQLIADTVMAFRFFVIWGYRKAYAVVPMVGFVLSDVITASFAAIATVNKSKRAVIIANVALGVHGILNIMLTILTAARIWWDSHKISRQIGKWSTKTTNTIITIVMESGVLYAIPLMAYVITNFFPTRRIDLSSIVLQIAAIAPTLIVARANARRCETQHDLPSEEGEMARARDNIITLTQLDDGTRA